MDRPFADLPLVKGWIAQPHWQAWWGAPERETAELAQSIDSDAVEPMIVEIDGRPNVQACMVEVREGMRVRRQQGARKPA